MQLVFIHGPAASGKLTIARELAKLTGFRLFHNHFVVDALLAVFEFGSPAFVRLREKMWLDTFREAAAAGTSLIFTFAPEKTVTPLFVADVVRAVEEAGGRVRFIEIACRDEILEQRLGDQSRAAFGKLTSPALYRELKAKGVFDYPMPAAELRIDSAAELPTAAAQRIAELVR